MAIKFHIMGTGQSLHHSPLQVADKVEADLLHHFESAFDQLEAPLELFERDIKFCACMIVLKKNRFSYTYFQNIPPLHC